MSETKQGTVKWFSAKKGYGFITGEDGTDYFAHFSQIQMDGFRNLSGKESVQFEVGEDANGRPLAVNIVPLVLEAGETEAYTLQKFPTQKKKQNASQDKTQDL